MPADNKKNPPLGAMTEGFDMILISPYEYLLQYRGFMTMVYDDSKMVLNIYF